jgi:predicted phosphodiesterase
MQTFTFAFLLLNLYLTSGLNFRSDKTFKIIQFTDLHFAVPEQDEKTILLQKTILEVEKPDLVVLSGDCVSNYVWDGSHPWEASMWRKYTQPMRDLNIPWVFVNGNHDQADLTTSQLVELDRTDSLSRTQIGPKHIHGRTNYYVRVRSSTSNSTSAYVWVFDTQTTCLGVKGWGCIHPDQVQWYLDTSYKLKREDGKIIPGVAFLHIPIPEFLDLWNFHTTYGRKSDDICCSSVNTGFFGAMKYMNNIISVHAGHDHKNDFIGEYQGITLGYGRKSGFGGYDVPSGWKRGARVIQLTETSLGIKFNSWIRQEDGSIDIPPEHKPTSFEQEAFCCGTRHKTRVDVFSIILLTVISSLALITTLWILTQLYWRRKCCSQPKFEFTLLS